MYTEDTYNERIIKFRQFHKEITEKEIDNKGS